MEIGWEKDSKERRGRNRKKGKDRRNERRHEKGRQ